MRDVVASRYQAIMLRENKSTFLWKMKVRKDPTDRAFQEGAGSVVSALVHTPPRCDMAFRRL
jgi:hypothetical protein